MNFNKIRKKAIVATTLSAFALQLAYPIDVYAKDEGTNREVVSQEKAVVNNLVNEGYLEESNNGLKITEKYKDEVNSKIDKSKYNVTFTDNSVKVSPKTSNRSFEGVNKVVYNKNFTIDLYLSNNSVRNLADGSAVGAAIAGLVPESVLTKITAAVLSIGGVVLNRVNSNGRGIIVTLGVNSNPVMAIQNPATIFVVKKVVSQ